MAGLLSAAVMASILCLVLGYVAGRSAGRGKGYDAGWCDGWFRRNAEDAAQRDEAGRYTARKNNMRNFFFNDEAKV